MGPRPPRAQLYPVQRMSWEARKPQKGFSWQEVWETWFRKIALDVGAEETEERQAVASTNRFTLQSPQK